MFNNNHDDFICSPLKDVLNEGIRSFCFLQGGIEEYPSREYILQSLFLKLAGAQEQKMRCICWEIASVDYEFRRDYLKSVSDYGEFSTYLAKEKVYKNLYTSLKKKMQGLSLTDVLYLYLFSDEQRKIHLNCILREFVNKICKRADAKNKKISDADLNARCKEIINKGVEEKDKQRYVCIELIGRAGDFISVLEEYKGIFGWLQHDINDFIDNKDALFSMDVYNACKVGFFGKDGIGLYNNIVYNHRNRCAHNLTSYQNNLPAFDTLANSYSLYYNYCFRFFLIILIDEMFVALYSAYAKMKVVW